MFMDWISDSYVKFLDSNHSNGADSPECKGKEKNVEAEGDRIFVGEL
jgi:hypothetical protein